MPKEKESCIDWTPHKAEIKEHYLVQDLSLKELLKYMEETHAFRATEAQYETQLKRWNFRKNMTKKEWDYTLLRMRKRKFDGKESDVYFNGSKVPEKKVKKQMSRHFSLIQKQFFDTTPIPSTPEAITVATPQATVDFAASSPNPSQSWLPALIAPRADFNLEYPPDNLLTRQDHLLPRFSSYREDLNTWHPQAGADVQAVWETNSVQTATGNIIINNLPCFRLQALFESAGQLRISPAQTPLIGSPRRRLPDFQTFNLPSFKIRDIHEKDALALLQGVTSSFRSMPNEEGQTLLAGLFGSSIKADGHELLSQIRSQMLVSSLEKHDGELVEKYQSLFASSNQHSLLQLLQLALYRLSNNLLSEDATDELLVWLIEQEQNELLVSFLQSRMPSVNACATKILESALRIGDAGFLEHLITPGIDLSPLKGARGGRNLVHAASESNIEIVQILLKNGADVDILTYEGYPYTALHNAVLNGQPQMIQVLLKAGANIEAVTADGGCQTALSIALGAKNIELVHILVTAGANLDICVVEKVPAIMYSALFCDDKLHQILLSRSGKDHISITSHGTWKAANGGIQALSKYLAESDHDDKLKYPAMKVLNHALGLAVENEDDQAILSLLAIGADPNAEVTIEYCNTTPLFKAVEYRNIEIVKILLQAGGSVDHPDLFFAASDSVESIEMYRFMLEMGANIATFGGPALKAAIWMEDLEAVDFLLFNGANVNHHDSGWPTALQLAIIRQNIELMEMLLDAGSDVKASTYLERLSSGQTALQSAVGRTGSSDLRLEIVQILLAAGADVNGPRNGRMGASTLQYAIRTGDEKLVEILLKEGADVNSLPRGKGGRSPIQEAAERGSIPLVKLLLQSGADVNASAGRDNGRTAIQAASSARNPTMELIDVLIDSGADIHAPAGLNGGATALQGAAIRGHIKIALKFLEAGADVNAAVAILYGRTALDGAAEHGRLDMVQMLLNAGARGDPTKAHRFGRAMELARINGHFTVAKLLEQT